ncbi:tyrosine-type recombinase/integrase [Microbacterium sp. ru370.1]|uniref:tyrosine-type recombinase/integrase n=1 Tax=Microbacterium sp. ru370.1 TaxID=1761809 RepID=UPI001C40B522|nr:tyrosine-type recombinase/integrase [Microbacterium sp. ru370.1]
MDGTIALRMRHVVDLACRVELTTATEDELHDILADRRGLAAETRKSMLASWRVYFGWALRRGHRRDDPTVEMKSIRVPVRVPRVAADGDIELALSRASDLHRAMVMLPRYAGLRLEEIARSHSDHRDGDMLRVLGKGNKERVVGLNEPLLAALRTLERDHSGYYFPGLRGEHMHKMSVNKIITRITGWNPHSLRHACATQAYRETGDLRAVQDMLGHASLATTQRYLHLDADIRRRVAAATIIRRERSKLAA